MKFMLPFSWKPDIKSRDEGIARFRKREDSLRTSVSLLSL